jgi:hypothetical protein
MRTLYSTGCTRPRPGFAFYNASKAAVSVGVTLEFVAKTYTLCRSPLRRWPLNMLPRFGLIVLPQLSAIRLCVYPFHRLDARITSNIVYITGFRRVLEMIPNLSNACGNSKICCQCEELQSLQILPTLLGTSALIRVRSSLEQHWRWMVDEVCEQGR